MYQVTPNFCFVIIKRNLKQQNFNFTEGSQNSYVSDKYIFIQLHNVRHIGTVEIGLFQFMGK